MVINSNKEEKKKMDETDNALPASLKDLEEAPTSILNHLISTSDRRIPSSKNHLLIIKDASHIERAKNEISEPEATTEDIGQEIRTRDQDISKTEFHVNTQYYDFLISSFRSSMKKEFLIIFLGIIGTFIGLIFRNTAEFTGLIFTFMAMFSFGLVALTLILLLRDLQFSSLLKLKYKTRVEKQGIVVFPPSNQAKNDPISYIPFNAITEVNRVRIAPYITNSSPISFSAKKFKQIASDLEGVLIKFRIDEHLAKKTNKQFFFDLPAGTTLYLLDDNQSFYQLVRKSLRSSKRKFK
jgi:hypothetical protein